MLEVAIKELRDVNFSPVGIEEIIQNIQTIVTTERFSVPLDREFGIDMSLVDAPMPTVQALFSKEIMTKVEKYEPRVKVLEVKYNDADEKGKLDISIIIKLRDGVKV